MTDIVERLIDASSKGKPDGNMMLASSELFAAAHLITSQADEIERLRAELAATFTESERRQNSIDHLRAELAHQTEMADVAHRTTVEIREERDRLRKLLQQVLSCGLNEEAHGVGFTASKQEIKAGELSRDIHDALKICDRYADYREGGGAPTLIGGAQQASQLGALMREQRSQRVTAGIPDGNPNCGIPVADALRTESVHDELQRLRKIEKAARALSDEGQEYSFDDIGLGRGAPNSYWEDLDEALDPEPEDE